MKPSMSQGKAYGLTGMGANFGGKQPGTPSTASRKGKTSSESFTQSEGVGQGSMKAKFLKDTPSADSKGAKGSY